MKNILLFLISIILSFSVIAQETKLFKNFGIDNPMSYNFVRTIAQDEDGFMWFGSSEGLDRFDGHQTLSFHHDSSLPNSLSSNVISRILIDKQQKLWVGTFGGGLNLYRPESKDFIHFTTKTKNVTLTNDTVNALFEDSEGKIWIATENGLNVLSTDKGKWSTQHILQELGNPNSLTHNGVLSIIETRNREIWVGTNGGGISVFNLQGEFIKSVKYGNPNSATYVNKFVSSMYLDSKGDIWIGTVDSGLLRYSLNTEQFIHYQVNADGQSTISSNAISKIYQDSENNMWIATDNGLSIYNYTTKNFSRYNNSPNNPYSISSDFVLTFFEDNNKMMWVGTFSGVNRWDPRMATFRQYSNQTNPILKNNNITSFTQFGKDNLFFSTYSGGIYKLSKHDNSIAPVVFNDSFSEYKIMTLFADGNTLWVGTRGSGLYSVDLATNNVTGYRHDAENFNSISANSITDIIKDVNGNLWVSTFHQGINLLNKNGTFKRFIKNESNLEKGPSGNHILQLLEDEQGFIWLGTFGGGLSRFDPKLEIFTHLLHKESNPEGISDDFTWFMLLDNNKNLWFGTQSSGLSMLSRENRYRNNFSFSHLNTKDGMKSLTVYGITQDANEDIWFSTNKGISRYSINDKSFKHFNLTHGLVDLEYTHSAVFRSIDNTIYFGAGKGMSSINPEKINRSLSVPEVRLTSVLKLNEPMPLGSSLSNLTELEFDYSDQIISFEYVGLNYSDPESTRYKYRLQGFDEEWIAAGKSRRATYTNLPAGSYTLQIIAGNNDNVWSEPGYSLAITVKPAPWNTWWAYLLYAMAVALTLLVYSRFLNRKLLVEQLQKSYLKEQVKEKTQKLQSQNSELEHANILLEKSATVDKVTGVRSRRYLDIYIEQTSQLMNQIHQNILPVQRSTLPRLYVLMVQVNELTNISNSQLINITDLLLFSRNTDDLVVRWSDDTFAVIGYEKDNNAGELAARLASKFEKQFDDKISMNIAYSFYPFNREQPMEISWDQVSVMIELGLTLTSEEPAIAWLGLCEPKIQPFSYLAVIQGADLATLKHNIQVKQG
ncbi:MULTISPECIES: two-component regulator propeller domain-containing protein [unclassified Colwellia]|uniref:two-component regulator propeller domain-containing protein n=1 Tax=unclassified Colwellia TaxID=196834 RepID=UPI0015F3F987|nr:MULTISPECIES: two-component regulator propeller domain-containing protein [unclassified Colwellia]MBA6355172.1 diguanylate cyclase [Colwellia sp. BRX8-3]MBA6361190.1 diguanylate cyclase [Colwellia sp. BRX8-6]MBA6366318.1 diguanylate cyclase [Colwellia sp. BRX8-5]MBA6375273.1 diguanylate cyclase [Colwellia sp. BRX8-2]